MILVAGSTRSFPLETPARALTRLAWAGFSAVEVAVPPDDPGFEESVRERLERDELGLAALDAGVVTANSPESALEGMAHIGRCAVMAYRLGAGRVLFSPPPEGAGGAAHLVPALAHLVGVLRDLPVLLALSPRAGSIVPNAAALADLCRAADAVASARGARPSARLRLALDPAECALAGGDPERALREALAEDAPVALGHVYLTDCLGATHAVLGEGELDWGSLSAVLLEGGYHGAVSVLLHASNPVFAEIEAKEAAGFAHALFPDAIYAPGEGR